MVAVQLAGIYTSNSFKFVISVTASKEIFCMSVPSCKKMSIYYQCSQSLNDVTVAYQDQ